MARMLLVTMCIAAAVGWMSAEAKQYMDCGGGRCIWSKHDRGQLISFYGGGGQAVSKQLYWHGRFDVRLRFPRHGSGGLIFAFYLVDPVTTTNLDPAHAEIDLEFYGTRHSRHIVAASNIFTASLQNLVQQALPFDPSTSFHTYSIIWNAKYIAWLIDDIPYRFLNRAGSPSWPERPMKVVVSIWDCSSWCNAQKSPDYSRGGLVLHVGGVRFVGCPVDSAWASNQGCPSWTSKRLPWNKNLTRWQWKKWATRSKRFYLNGWGWTAASG